ncbi:MAG: xylose isomerase [Candidatus Binatia bacterium]|nr:xylose isomerase [Candidatus Binatia bacterium]MDG2008697.1 xylose isomerase [Candidatus Binatia bacterium]HAC78748.1 xylose isomerase [Deltaproteobacteria bacterium]
MQEFFPGIGKIPFEGPRSSNPFAYRFYEADRMVHGRRMEDHLRIAVCWWHTLCAPGSDVFGAPTLNRPWHAAGGDEMAQARQKVAVGFEFFEKLGNPYFCFHDRDIAPEGDTLAASCDLFDRILEDVEAAMARSGTKLLWGTANLFGHPRYAAGAATNPDPEIFAYAAAQVKHVLEATHRLGGENYVLWGGREGYDTLLNTDLRREQEQLGRFLSLVVEHKHRIGFSGTILIEPKPCEPTKHQYDTDAATVIGFLRRFGLEKEVKLNIEVNHATLAGHSFHHEIAWALAEGMLGSVDANRGDPQNGWDTDQFPNDHVELTPALFEILKAGGLDSGGFNFDAHLRRQSIAPEDLFHAHIGGIDTLARALLCAEALFADGALQAHVDERYDGWEGSLGKEILSGEASLADLDKRVRDQSLDPSPRSARQEMLENLLNRFT